jgi:hypothetical protein
MISLGIICLIIVVTLKYSLFEKSNIWARIIHFVPFLIAWLAFSKVYEGKLIENTDIEFFIFGLISIILFLSFEIISNKYLKSKGKIPGIMPKEIHLWKSSKHND